MILDLPRELTATSRFCLYEWGREGWQIKYDIASREFELFGISELLENLGEVVNAKRIIKAISEDNDETSQIFCDLVDPASGDTKLLVYRVKVGQTFLSYRNLHYYSELDNFRVLEEMEQVFLHKIPELLDRLKLTRVRAVPVEASVVNFIDFVL